jgi:type IV secretory pathway TraG/TraD family ATPase VirD4
MYGDADATTIINNCDRYIYLGGMDLLTCRNISERMGIPLTEVMYMPLGQEFVFERGKKPVITERWHITEDPEWQRLQ